MNLECKISPKRLTFDFFPIHNQDLLYQSSSYEFNNYATNTKGRYHSTHRFSLYWLNQRWMHFTSKVLRSGEVKRKGSNIDMSWFLVILAWHKIFFKNWNQRNNLTLKTKSEAWKLEPKPVRSLKLIKRK